MKLPAVFRHLCLCCGAWLLLGLTACSSTAPATRLSFDFGPWPQAVAGKPAGKLQISLAQINVAAALDSNAMLYRLQYRNVQQLQPYALHRWSMPPAQLLEQRIKAGLGAQGISVLSQSDGATDLPVLRMELDEFSQVFSSADASHAQIGLRASLIRQHRLVAQRNFQQQTAAASADAPGGARAMQQAADTLIAELQQWLQSLPPN